MVFSKAEWCKKLRTAVKSLCPGKGKYRFEFSGGSTKSGGNISISISSSNSRSSSGIRSGVVPALRVM